MNKYIFICTKNIFRSQIAKGLCDQISKHKVYSEAYGILVESEGNSNKSILEFPWMSDTVNILKEIDIDISNEECKQVTPSSLEGAKKVIVMAEREYIPEWLNKYQYEYWEINYPKTITNEYTKILIETLKEKVTKLLKENSEI